ncbi:MAG: DUF192 domain-containing protein [Bacilli bacterium]|nr:DUF192 domain-containing protein [Bacilli bacterium]
MIDKIKIYEAKTFKQRLFGLMFKKNIDYCLLFKKCNSIHTFFMKEKIDVVMTDKNNKIIYIKKNMKKNRIILPKKNVYYTYEFPSNFIKDLKINDQLKIRD